MVGNGNRPEAGGCGGPDDNFRGIRPIGGMGMQVQVDGSLPEPLFQQPGGVERLSRFVQDYSSSSSPAISLRASSMTLSATFWGACSYRANSMV